MTGDIATVDPVSTTPPVSDEPTEDAPFGWMNDPETGERRPRKRPGRRSKTAEPPSGKTPSLEALQDLGTLPEASDDRAPGVAPKMKAGRTKKQVEIPPFRAGAIAKGVNRLYRRAGRIIRLFDYDIGSAVVFSATRRPKDQDDEDDEDLTVGEAWENLARTNPRIRLFLHRFINGGAYSGLFMAHVPIFMALAMKDGIRERIPIMKLAEVFLTDDQDGGGGPVPSDMAQAMGGIGPDDLAQMMAMAQSMMGQVAADMPRAQAMPRDPNAEAV